MINYRFYQEDNAFYREKKIDGIKGLIKEIILMIFNSRKIISLYLKENYIKIKSLEDR